MRHEIYAPVVGCLADLCTDEGSQVEEGQTVATMESMKIMFPLYAPVAGRVSFLLELGELAGEGEVVAVVESTG